MATANSNQGGLAFAFSGNNAFAFSANQGFAFAGNQAFAFGGAIDGYGFSGAPGNPMLVAGLSANAEAALKDLLPTTPAAWQSAQDRTEPTALPALEVAARIEKWGAAPRAALIQSELAGRIGFAVDAANASVALQVLEDKKGLSGLVRLIRPPSVDYFKAQLRMVDRDSSIRDSRAPEILTQVTTPMSYFAATLNMQSERHRKTLELLDHCLRFAYMVGMRFKHEFAVPRPSDLSARIVPMIEVPQHGAYPMGHATESHVIAGVLGRLVPGLSAEARRVLRRTAGRISHNRVVAGMHYPVDLLAGRLLGDALGELLATWGSNDGASVTPFGFEPPTKPEDGEAGPDDPLGDMSHGVIRLKDAAGSDLPAFKPTPAPMLQALWAAALREWQV